MTSFDTVAEMFFRRVEKDKEFWLHVGLDHDASMDLARERARGYLREAVGTIMMQCHPTINFYSQSDGSFDEDLTDSEIYLLSCLMYRQHLDRDIAYLKTLSRDYTATDLRVFSPSDARTSFMAMYRHVCNECDHLMDIYRNTDRETGSFVTIDFAKYDG